MPYFLKALAVVGTAAMLWVGGGIIIHGLEEFGLSGIGHAVHGIAEAAAHALPAMAAAVDGGRRRGIGSIRADRRSAADPAGP